MAKWRTAITAKRFLGSFGTRQAFDQLTDRWIIGLPAHQPPHHLD
jgi:hypothetical protein